MTSKLDTTPSSGDRVKTRAYLREFVPGMVGYPLVLIAVMVWGDIDGTSSWRFLWALAPAVPIVWIAVAVYRHTRRVDDFQRLQLLQGFGVGFAAAMATSVTLGLLDIAGLDLVGQGWIIYGVGMLGWFVTSIVLSITASSLLAAR